MFTKKTIGALTAFAMAVTAFSGLGATAFAAQVQINDPHPITDDITVNGTKYVVASTSVTIPEGVTVNNGSFNWIVTATGTPYGMDSVFDDSSDIPGYTEDNTDTETLTDNALSDADMEAQEEGLENSTDILGEDIADNSAEADFQELSNNTYTATVPAKLNFAVTDATIVMQLIVAMDGNDTYGIDSITDVELREAE